MSRFQTFSTILIAVLSKVVVLRVAFGVRTGSWSACCHRRPHRVHRDKARSISREAATTKVGGLEAAALAGRVDDLAGLPKSPFCARQSAQRPNAVAFVVFAAACFSSGASRPRRRRACRTVSWLSDYERDGYSAEPGAGVRTRCDHRSAGRPDRPRRRRVSPPACGSSGNHRSFRSFA